MMGIIELIGILWMVTILMQISFILPDHIANRFNTIIEDMSINRSKLIVKLIEEWMKIQVPRENVEKTFLIEGKMPIRRKCKTCEKEIIIEKETMIGVLEKETGWSIFITALGQGIYFCPECSGKLGNVYEERRMNAIGTILKSETIFSKVI